MSEPSSSSTPEPKPKEGMGRKLQRAWSTDTRTHFWNFLDMLEEKPVLRRSLCFGLPALIVAAAGLWWGYQHWERINSTKIAREWLDAGRLDRAAPAVQEAIAFSPKQPEPWRLASELAWKRGNKAAAVEYAKRAAEVSEYGNDEVIAWGEAAVLAGQLEDAGKALNYLSRDEIDASGRASRLAGEIARRHQDLASASVHFQKALDVDTANAVDALADDEVPLGLCLLNSPKPEDRKRGISLLSKWTRELSWGAEALRALLADAILRQDKPAMLKWAEQLRAHPRCTVADVPQCLMAADRADEARFQAMLAATETTFRQSPTMSAELIGWLAAMGRSEDALAWAKTLKPQDTHRPPMCTAIAEALRGGQRWTELQGWTGSGDWGTESDFLRLTFQMEADRHLGNTEQANSVWSTLQAQALQNGVHGLFMADALYTWGEKDQAIDLLWKLTTLPGVAIQALGTLARHYQVGGDAHGQYRAFAKLYSLRPDDPAIANNYVYFSMLSKDGEQTSAERIAKANVNREPRNLSYVATYAYFLTETGRSREALKVLAPFSADWAKNPAIAYAYAVTLGAEGRRDDAKQVVAGIDRTGMSVEEKAQLDAAVQ